MDTSEASEGFAGKVAHVTGAGSGIGRAIALKLAEKKVKVGVIDVSRTSAEAVVAEIAAGGGSALAVVVDVADGDAIKEGVEQLETHYGRLDFAFNNAGMMGPFNIMLSDIEDSDWARVIAVNLTSVFLCMKYQIPLMERSGGGAIVNTASVAGLQAAPRAAAYGAAKHGVVGLTRAAAAQYAARGIRINALCPGLTNTPLLHGQKHSDDFARFPPLFAPIARIGEADEIANAAIWLVSPTASYLVGVALPVDGGIAMM